MYLRMLVTMVVALFTTRINYQALGIDNFGIYNVVGSVIVFFSFINVALTASTRRYITAEIAKGTEEGQRNVFNLAFFAHIIIAVVIVIIGETAGLWAVNHMLNIPEERMYAANVVYQLSIFTAVMNVMQAPYSAAITANERMNIYAYIAIFEVFAKLAVAFGVLYLPGDKLILYAVLMTVSSTLVILINRAYCHRSFSMCRFQKPHDKRLLKEMFGYMGWSLGGQMMNVFTNQGVTMLVNMFFSVAANAAMGVSNQITHIVSGFVGNFQTAFNPQITKQYVAGNYDELNSFAIRTSRYSSYLVLVFMIPICCQIHEFLSLWLGEYPQYAVEFCILTLFSIYFDAITGPLWMLITSDKDIKKYQIIISSVVSFNFIGAWIFLILGFPPYSVIIARLIVYLVSTAIRLVFCKEKVSSFPVSEWLKHAFFKPLFISIVPVASFFLINQVSTNIPILDLIIKSGTVFFITCLSIFVGLTQNEKMFILKKVHLSNLVSNTQK